VRAIFTKNAFQLFSRGEQASAILLTNADFTILRTKTSYWKKAKFPLCWIHRCKHYTFAITNWLSVNMVSVLEEATAYPFART